MKVSKEDLHEVGAKVIEKWNAQLPILKECEEVLNENPSSVTVLPMVVHNLSVICSERIYKLIPNALTIYKHIDLRTCRKEIRDIVSDVVTKSRGVLEVMSAKESESAEKNADCEDEYRQHVEADMSGFYRNLSYLMSMGLEVDDFVEHYIEEAVSICKDICKYGIEKGNTAIATSQTFLHA